MGFQVKKSTAETRYEVQEYHDHYPFGTGVADCFVPWYLQNVCQLGHDSARLQSSSGKDDFGIDGFNIEDVPNGKRLTILQGKYSDDVALAQLGVRDFAGTSVEKLAELLNGSAPGKFQENLVISNLRSGLAALSQEQRAGLEIEFGVLHLIDKSTVDIVACCSQELSELQARFREEVPDHTYRGCRFLEYRAASAVQAGVLRVEGGFLNQGMTDPKVFFGVVSLAVLIAMYETFGDDLFEENVRYFIASRKNTRDEGPVGNMWQTLVGICLEKRLAPESFTIYHNGVCVCCSALERRQGSVKLFKPRVVNGCQTIKGIHHLMRTERNKKQKGKFDRAIWEQIRVPIRIVETSRETDIYRIAINNNRQNAIGSVALRSNDLVQRKLKDGLRALGIFYERQEEEYKNLLVEGAVDLRKEYQNTSPGQPMQIWDLGQAIAAVKGNVDMAASASRIFEDDKSYRDVFGEGKVPYDLRFLVALHNVAQAIAPALKAVKANIDKYSDLNPRTIKWVALFLVMRYLRKYEPEFIVERHQMTMGPSSVRDDLVKLLKRSGILQVIHEVYLVDGEDGQTVRSKRSELLKRAANKLSVGQVDPRHFQKLCMTE